MCTLHRNDGFTESGFWKVLANPLPLLVARFSGPASLNLIKTLKLGLNACR